MKLPDDIGAESVAIGIAENLVLPFVTMKVSRLIIDVNRPLNSDTLFKQTADGSSIKLNENLTAEDKQDRIDRYWKPYRNSVRNLLLDLTALKMLLSIHSYTPLYEGEIRTCEIGVLYTESKEEGSLFLQEFSKRGWKVEDNKPWPGSICDILNVAHNAGKKGIVLELRNDLATDQEYRSRFVSDVDDILRMLDPQL